jgi:hypothetical protein
MEGFTGRIDMVNAVAERSKGFVWRLQTDSGNALDIQVSDDPRFIINISLWEDVDSLRDFVWKTVHARLIDAKAQWFKKSQDAHMALWWVPIGHRPSAAEGMARLHTLNTKGQTSEAFDWPYVMGRTL